MTLLAAAHDEASAKGAVEFDDNTTQNSLAGQLGHRDEDDMLKDNDTDFPEPDAHAEITGSKHHLDPQTHRRAIPPKG